MANYIQGLFHGICTLLTGLKVTGKEFVTPKITEQYPENRATLKMNERFCGTLTMPHDAEGKNKCVACGLCQAACPNGTIKITTETVTDEETGKPRRRLVKYEYDLGACMFCHPVRERLSARRDPFRHGFRTRGLYPRQISKNPEQITSWR